MDALLFGEVRGEGGRGCDHVCLVENVGEVAPCPLRHLLIEHLGQMEVEDEVVGHEVVCGDHGDAELPGGPDQGAPHEQVALGMHHVGSGTLHRLEDAPA